MTARPTRLFPYRLATLASLCAGLCLVALARLPLAPVPLILEFLACGFPEEETVARYRRLALVVLLAGLLLLALAATLWFGRRRLPGLLSRFGRRFASSTRAFGADLAHLLRELVADRRSLIWLLLLTLAGIAVRVWFLDQPMRYDEAHTFLAFVLPRNMRLFFYGAPNNHVAHSLLVYLSTAILGGEPWAIRLPAFLAGVLLIPAAYVCARVVFQPASGLLAAALVAANPLLVFYSTNARGYSAVALFTLVLVPLVPYVVREASLFGGFLVALLAALGLYTIPTMAFPLAMLGVWALLLAWQAGGRSRVLHLVPLGAGVLTLCAAVTIVLYTPVVVMSGVEALVANSWVLPETLVEAAGDWPRMFWETWLRCQRDVPLLFQIGLVGLVLAGVVQLWRVNRRALLLVPSAVAGALVLLAALRVVPFFRVWIYLPPLLFCLADVGLAGLTGLLSPRARMRLAGVLGLALALYLTVYLAMTGTVARYPETGAMPDAEAMAHYLQPRLREGDYILARNPANLPLRYYSLRLGIPLEAFVPGGEGDIFVVVHQPRDTFEKVTRGADLPLDAGDYTIQAFPSSLLYIPKGR